MKWIIRLIGFVLVIILVAGVSLFFLPADKIAKLAADQIRLATGRNVTINGDVSMTLWPVLGISADGLEVGNADWARQGPMLTAENTTIGVDALSLLSGEIRFTNIEATRPTIRLESRADGRASWIFTDASGAAQIETATSPDRAAQAVLIERLEITDATLIYDAEGADLVSYSGVDLTLDWQDRLGAAEISATLSPADSDVDLQATIDGFAGFIAGEVRPLDVSVTAGGGTARLIGRGSTAGEVAGQLTLNLDSTDAFFAALALPQPKLPARLGRSVQLSTDLTLTPDRRLALRALDVDLGGNRLVGAADINLNGTPQINAQLQAGALDLTSATQSDGGGASSPAGQGWPKDRIDASALATFNGQIALTAASVDLGQFNLGVTRVLLRNDRSRMVFELREVVAYDGTVTGEFVVNNRSGLSMGGKLLARGMGMQGLLRDAIGFERLTGQADGELSFLTSGASVDALMNALSGEGAISFGKGTIIGIDLDRLMRSGQVGGGTTVFDSLGATFDMDAGVLRNDDLLLKLSAYEARGEGQVGLGAQTIDYTFTPIALRANSGAGIAIPVRIRGPWASPRILPDLEAAIDLNFSEEKERLKQEAETALRERIAKELNLGDDSADDLEGAAQQKLEKEITKGLRKLFD
ncbi:AsmA family protein [Tateyamaria pelophila]|uniref:AsmA family protein n=1 Tax=Tateyamaria pelophila TaxID=328415 RepID=UPI001CBD1DFD|nr:AsmA family protein [Tateyamaria pelophila]